MERLRTIAWSRGRLLRMVLLAPLAYLVAACSGEDGGDTSQAATGGSAVPTGQAATPASAHRSGVEAAATASRSDGAVATPAQTLAPTPACADDDDEPTPAQTEGPYFTPGSPQRASLLEAGLRGTKLTLTGTVLTTGCRPVARALIDFWQCDDAGEYDNRGFRLRGHQFTDTTGRYTLETILPGVYTGRTRHIHVKVQAPNRPVLTTQLYFPNEPGNARDRIFREECVIAMNDAAGGKAGTFDFVLDV